ncbi:MAG: signal recognition particle-docking protein FtsY [Myxococcaceae bacterium]|nr:signal recognition particle-docking protein FtsY [Myxococcaceae bacterium]MBH2006850.1 signal recognition particle-docking protein FtsY [Myxococcaceae bacterium]
MTLLLIAMGMAVLLAIGWHRFRKIRLLKSKPSELEVTLLKADLGLGTTQALLEQAQSSEEIKKQVEKMLSIASPLGLSLNDAPTVILFVGVNGVGKTTSIGKMAAQLKAKGKKVVLGAGDTFRAAAGEQLEIWAKRTDSLFVSRPNGDPASVLFDAVVRAQKEGCDYVLCDTAGRLHTKDNLMEELKKIHRVLGKALPGAPHEVFLVLDGTTGQNALSQAREFAQSTPVTGIILTKMDGTAKGGMIVAITRELKIPIRFVGVGETAEDLKVFDPKAFTEALFEN